MATVTVSPLRQRSEILFVLISTVAILLTGALLIAIKKNAKDGPKRLRSYQISGITDLSGNNQGLFTDLYTAALEIETYHRANERLNQPVWPEITYLEDEFYAPFTQDAMWKERGNITWKKRNTGTGDESIHIIAYVGRTNNIEKAGSFLILFEHFHSADGTYYNVAGRKRPYSIWFRGENFDLPGEISEGTLIKNGWKEVVSFTGKDQRKKLNR